MNRTLFVISLFLAILTSTESSNQPLLSKSNLMILTNGQTHAFKKWKLLKDELNIIGPKGERLILRADDVEGYFDKQNLRRYYKKKIKSNYMAEMRDPDYEFVQIILDGRIRLYQSFRKLMALTPSAPGLVAEYLVEKDDVYEYVISAGTSRRESREVLKAMVGDDPQLLEKVSSEEFNINFDNILELVNNYNVRSFQGFSQSAYNSMGSVVFYVWAKKDPGVTLSLNVNDTINYELSIRKPLTVKLPAEAPSKVCFVSGTRKACTVMAAFSFGRQYWQLMVDRGLSLKMNRESVDDALYYLNYLKRYRNSGR